MQRFKDHFRTLKRLLSEILSAYEYRARHKMLRAALAAS